MIICMYLYIYLYIYLLYIYYIEKDLLIYNVSMYIKNVNITKNFNIKCKEDYNI